MRNIPPTYFCAPDAIQRHSHKTAGLEEASYRAGLAVGGYKIVRETSKALKIPPVIFERLRRFGLRPSKASVGAYR